MLTWCVGVQVPMLPLPPPHVERSAALLGEYESVARQIRQSCHQVALLDRIHSIKVRPSPFFHPLADSSSSLPSTFRFCQPVMHHV